MGIVRHRPAWAVAALLAVAALAGCTGGVDTASSPATSTAHDAGSKPGTAQLPDSPVGRQARWVLDELGHDTGPAVDVAAERFAAEFLTEVPADDVRTVFDQLRPLGPWRPVNVDVTGRDAVVGLLDGSGRSWRMVISVDADGDITTLVVQPAPGAEAPAASTWQDLHDQLTALDADVGLLAARVTDAGRCEPISRIDPRSPRPIASIFKLYVLGALATAVADGDVAWSDQLTITDDTRSLPTGELQNEPDGTGVSVAEAAAGMIAVSDNTGADLLALLLGRDAVEAAMADMGHADPQLNTPFLTTRELFSVGWGPGGLRDRWAAADTAGRQQMLAGLPSGALPLSASDVRDPAWPAGVGWFASAADVCAALVSLHEETGTANDQQLRDILSSNRGVNIDSDMWPYVAFKGGSAPGVVTGSWYAERVDGHRFVYVMLAAAAEPSALADHTAFFQLAEDAFDLLAEQ